MVSEQVYEELIETNTKLNTKIAKLENDVENLEHIIEDMKDAFKTIWEECKYELKDLEPELFERLGIDDAELQIDKIMRYFESERLFFERDIAESIYKEFGNDWFDCVSSGNFYSDDEIIDEFWSNCGIDHRALEIIKYDIDEGDHLNAYAEYISRGSYICLGEDAWLLNY